MAPELRDKEDFASTLLADERLLPSGEVGYPTRGLGVRDEGIENMPLRVRRL